MKADAKGWLRFAEEDFHCQQCVEKYLKARLEEAGLPVPKVHSLTALLALLLPLEPLWASFNPTLLLLNNYAVKFRYPGHVATRADARAAVKACRSIRAEIRHSLGLPRK